jgi:hypothetical protein
MCYFVRKAKFEPEYLKTYEGYVQKFKLILLELIFIINLTIKINIFQLSFPRKSFGVKCSFFKFTFKAHRVFLWSILVFFYKEQAISFTNCS